MTLDSITCITCHWGHAGDEVITGMSEVTNLGLSDGVVKVSRNNFTGILKAYAFKPSHLRNKNKINKYTNRKQKTPFN